MSGLTTTGATILTGLDQLPDSINLWRCLLQWIGGMGILILAAAILPLLGVGGSQLFRAEAAGPMKDAKLTPRIAETAKGLWVVYSGMSLACLLAYWSAGMPWMDAWMHMFATVSLGGLSSHDASFGHFQSAELEWICIVFMLIASCNFAVYFVALHKRAPGRIFGDLELRATLCTLIGASVLVAGMLLVENPPEGVGQTIRHAFFNVVSIGTTTGFSTLDHTAWPPVASVLMLLLSGVATSAGSTGAGIKMVRVIILFKLARREMRRILHPRAVTPVMLNGRPVSNETILAVLAFMLVYGVAIIVFTLLLIGSGLSFDVGFSAAVASVNNMGPGLGAIGPAGTFAPLDDFQTWVCTVAMLLGRLELLTVLVLFTPQFWRQ
jgi:trk system potassium uptake protein TrkH